MADDNTKPTEPVTEQQQQNAPQTPPAPAEAENTESGIVSQMVPKDRFNEVNEGRKAAEERAAKAEAELVKHREAQAKAEREAAEKRGEFEQLYKSEQTKVTDLTTQLETANAELEKLRGVVNAQLEKRMETVPDHIKPLLANMDALAAIGYLDAHADQFAPADGPRKQTPPPMHGGDGAQRRGEKEPMFKVGRVRI